jgi:hypothetical protein
MCCHIVSSVNFHLPLNNSQCPLRLSGRVRRSCDAEKIDFSSDSGDSGSKICKASGGFWRESGVSRSVLCWCFWQESGVSRCEGVLTYLINKFYKFCTFNATCKDNAATNCTTVQHKQG